GGCVILLSSEWAEAAGAGLNCPVGRVVQRHLHARPGFAWVRLLRASYGDPWQLDGHDYQRVLVTARFTYEGDREGPFQETWSCTVRDGREVVTVSETGYFEHPGPPDWSSDPRGPTVAG